MFSSEEIRAIQAVAIAMLRESVRDPERFVKVRAAEACLQLNISADVNRIFRSEEAKFGTEPQYRVVIWRVLAQAAADDSDRQRWVTRIVDAFLDEQGPDRLHAVNSATKLHTGTMKSFVSPAKPLTHWCGQLCDVDRFKRRPSATSSLEPIELNENLARAARQKVRQILTNVFDWHLKLPAQHAYTQHTGNTEDAQDNPLIRDGCHVLTGCRFHATAGSRRNRSRST